jgi:hypothetical protein
MLLIGGAAPLRDAETLPLQGGFDQLALFKPITKWAHQVTHTERIPDLVAQALRVATTGRPGPVYLEVPIDVLFARVDEEKVVFPEQVRPQADPAQTTATVAGSPTPARSCCASPSERASRCSRTPRPTASCLRTTRSAGTGSPTWSRCARSGGASRTSCCWSGRAWVCSPAAEAPA